MNFPGNKQQEQFLVTYFPNRSSIIITVQIEINWTNRRKGERCSTELQVS